MKIRKDMIAHLCIIAIIAVILLISVFKLVKWNQGTSDAGAVETDENFDVETEDYVTAFDRDSSYVDDGKNTIVFLGDDVLAKYPGKDGVSEQVATLLGSSESPVVYNCGFEGSMFSASNSFWDGENPQDAFSLYWVVKSICLQDYTLLNTTVDQVNPDYKGTIETLEGIDFSTVDTIVILGSSNDYLNKKQVTDPADPLNTVAYTGALNASLNELKTTYPNIRVVVTAPTYCEVEQDGNYVGCDVTNTEYGTLPDYMVAAKAICVEDNITFLDNYYGLDITADTLEADHVLPNADGRKQIAQRITDLLQGKIKTTS